MGSEGNLCVCVCRGKGKRGKGERVDIVCVSRKSDIILGK